MFNADPLIVFVGLLDDQCNVVGLEIREGYHVMSSKESISDYISTAAPIVVGSFVRRQQIWGNLTAVMAKHEKRIVVYSPLKEQIVVAGFDPQAPTPILNRTVENIKNASNKL